MLSLSDAIANAVLFAGDAKTDSKGLVRVLIAEEVVIFQSYDDYIYLEQTVALDHHIANHEFYVEKKALKEAGEDGFWTMKEDGVQGDDELFQSLSQSLHQFPDALLGKFTFPSDRFGKISRIKGDEPCVVTLGEDLGMKLAKFTKGPSVKGMMAFLEEE